MEASSIDVMIFGPLAPICGVLLFWFIQLLFIESQKYFLSEIKTRHEALCRFTNFLGIFFQTFCHALGYTITRSGVSSFYVSVHHGEVEPKKEKKGVFEWISNIFLFIGPFFIPASLLLIPLYFLIKDGFQIVTTTTLIEIEYTFAGQMILFGQNLYAFSIHLFGFLFNIDLLHPAHLGFLLLLIFIGMGIRPSHIGKKRRKKIDMVHDLKNIWSLIRHKPLYIICLLIVSYTLFYLSLFLKANWYIGVFSVLGWLSIISILSILIANMIILMIKNTDSLPGIWRVTPYLILPISYISARLFFIYILENTFSKSLSLLIMIISVLASIFLLKKKIYQ